MIECVKGVSNLWSIYNTLQCSKCTVVSLQLCYRGQLCYYYVYMSSDGPQKRDSPFWHHCTIRFTCLKIIFVWQKGQWISTVQASEQRIVWSWKACTLTTDFTNFAIAVHASHEVGAVNYGSCCTL